MSGRHRQRTLDFTRGLPVVVRSLPVAVLGLVLGAVLGVVLDKVLGNGVPGAVVGGVLCSVVYALYGQALRGLPLWLGFLPSFASTFSSSLSLEATFVMCLSFVSALSIIVLVEFLKSRRNDSP